MLQVCLKYDNAISFSPSPHLSSLSLSNMKEAPLNAFPSCFLSLSLLDTKSSCIQKMYCRLTDGTLSF